MRWFQPYELPRSALRFLDLAWAFCLDLGSKHARSGPAKVSGPLRLSGPLENLQFRYSFFQRFAVIAMLLDQIEDLIGREAVLVREIAHFTGIARRDSAAVALRV
jgi:hypothetical protein